jgi:hypothetical protein
VKFSLKKKYDGTFMVFLEEAPASGKKLKKALLRCAGVKEVYGGGKKLNVKTSTKDFPVDAKKAIKNFVNEKGTHDIQS